MPNFSEVHKYRIGVFHFGVSPRSPLCHCLMSRLLILGSPPC